MFRYILILVIFPLQLFSQTFVTYTIDVKDSNGVGLENTNVKLDNEEKLSDLDGRVQFVRTITSINSIEKRTNTEGTIGSGYPNPFSSEATVSFNVNKNQDVSTTLFDILGRKVYSEVVHVTSGTYNTTISGLSNLSKGVYFLSIKGSGFSNTIKFIKLNGSAKNITSSIRAKLIKTASFNNTEGQNLNKSNSTLLTLTAKNDRYVTYSTEINEALTDTSITIVLNPKRFDMKLQFNYPNGNGVSLLSFNLGDYLGVTDSDGFSLVNLSSGNYPLTASDSRIENIVETIAADTLQIINAYEKIRFGSLASSANEGDTLDVPSVVFGTSGSVSYSGSNGITISNGKMIFTDGGSQSLEVMADAINGTRRDTVYNFDVQEMINIIGTAFGVHPDSASAYRLGEGTIVNIRIMTGPKDIGDIVQTTNTDVNGEWSSTLPILDDTKWYAIQIVAEGHHKKLLKINSNATPSNYTHIINGNQDENVKNFALSEIIDYVYFNGVVKNDANFYGSMPLAKWNIDTDGYAHPKVWIQEHETGQSFSDEAKQYVNEWADSVDAGVRPEIVSDSSQANVKMYFVELDHPRLGGANGKYYVSKDEETNTLLGGEIYIWKELWQGTSPVREHTLKEELIQLVLNLRDISIMPWGNQEFFGNYTSSLTKSRPSDKDRKDIFYPIKHLPKNY